MAAAESIPPSAMMGDMPGQTQLAKLASEWLRKLNAIRTLLWAEDKTAQAMARLNALKPDIQHLSKEKVAHTDSALAGAIRAYWELMGYALFQQRQYRRASDAFSLAGNVFLSGHMYLLAGQVPKALSAFSSLASECAPPDSPGQSSHWGMVLLGLVTGQLNCLPTVLQIRHHLERDVAHLAMAGQHGFLNQLCQYAGVLAQVNTETYKLIGRGMLHAGYPQQGTEWLLLAQQVNAQDPELYFHLGQAYSQTRQWLLASRCLKQCLLMTDSYPPAETLLVHVATQAVNEATA